MIEQGLSVKVSDIILSKPQLVVIDPKERQASQQKIATGSSTGKHPVIRAAKQKVLPATDKCGVLCVARTAAIIAFAILVAMMMLLALLATVLARTTERPSAGWTDYVEDGTEYDEEGEVLAQVTDYGGVVMHGGD